nr:MAG TPA: hypothetical protein [Bacteriophage sp.]
MYCYISKLYCFAPKYCYISGCKYYLCIIIAYPAIPVIKAAFCVGFITPSARAA